MKPPTIFLFIAAVAAFCDHGTSAFHKRSAAGQAPPFAFHGSHSALFWHTLDPSYAICATGKNQSPINVQPGNNSVTVKGSTLDLSIPAIPHGVEVENLGTAIQASLNGSLCLGNGKSYKLVQHHYHTPSEHVLNDEYYPMEVHFVFQAPDESLAVVGLFINVCDTTASPFLRSVLPHVARIPDKGNVARTGPVDLTDVVDHIKACDVYQYQGSLTTPPCSEGIAWNVVSRPLSLDVATYNLVKGVLGFNSRFTQGTPGQDNVLLSAGKTV